MKGLKEEAIRNFVCKNYSEEIPKKMVKYFLKRSIGPNENGLVAIFKDNEGCVVVDKNGRIVGPS